MRQFAKTPAYAIIAICFVWIIGALAFPLLYARLKGWGSYWAFSAGGILLDLPLLLGLPLLLVLVWRRARGRSPDESAV